jgi:hypothetical protein
MTINDPNRNPIGTMSEDGTEVHVDFTLPTTPGSYLLADGEWGSVILLRHQTLDEQAAAVVDQNPEG